MTGAIALLLVLQFVSVAIAAPTPPGWVTQAPKDAKYVLLSGASGVSASAAAARGEAVKDAIRKLNLLVGYDDAPEALTLQKAFNRKLLQALIEERDRGPGVVDTFQQDLGDGKAKVFVLLRVPKSQLAEARSEIASKRSARLSVQKAAVQIAEALSRYAAVEPVFGTIGVQGFREQESGKRFKVSGVLETEIARALSRLDDKSLKVAPSGQAALVLTGDYRLSDTKKSLLLTAQLQQVRPSTVLWTSPEFEVTDGDFADLQPPVPAAAASAPIKEQASPPKVAEAKPKQAAKPLSVQQKVGKPRIMVILPEVHLTRPAPDPAGETELIRQLLEAGFKVVDQTQSKKIRENEQYVSQLRNDPKKVAALGREYGAELVVFGEAFSETVTNTASGVRVMARVEARAVRCDTAEILVAHGLEAEATEGSELVSAKKALRQAGHQVAAYFVQQLANRWSREAAGGRSIEVLISDISYPELMKLKATLKNDIEGVQAFHQRHYEENLARFEVDFAGDPQDLVDTLVSQEIGGHRLELTKLTGSKVELRYR